MERKTTELKKLLELKQTSIKRQEEMNDFYKSKFTLYKSAGPHQRETTAIKQLNKLNKAPLMEMAMVIWEELEKARVFINNVVSYCNDESGVKTNNLVSSLENSFTDDQDITNSPVITSGLDDQLDDINKKLTSWGNNIVTDMKDILKNEISSALPCVVKETVKEMSNNSKLTKPWTDFFKKSQEELKAEAKNAFHVSLTTALKESQHEIIENVQIKNDSNIYERERRSRNIVIGKCPESTADNPAERLQYDLEFVKSVTGLSDSEIIKCIRAGPKENREKGIKKTSRPIIVTVHSPDLAKRLHKYGNGNRIIYNNTVWWVNPDLTISERGANFRAREYRKLRLQQSSSGLGNTNI